MSDQEKSVSRVMAAIEQIRLGRMVIMVDDEDRENEGDLVFAAEHVTADKINFMAKEARGLICLTLDPPLVDRLKLPLMAGTSAQDSGRMTAFTVSIEARDGVSTGISAFDRAHTIKVAVDDLSTPEDLVVPGHIFPLRAKCGGVLERAGHTEGSVDLARLAGVKPAGVICEIMRDDGAMARRADLDDFSQKHSIPVVTIADIINFRLLNESHVSIIGRRRITSTHGIFEGVLFQNHVDGTCAFALVKGQQLEHAEVHVRVHNQRILEDVFSPRGTEEPSRIEFAMRMLSQHEHAVLVYLPDTMQKTHLLHQLESMAVPDGQNAKLAGHIKGTNNINEFDDTSRASHEKSGPKGRESAPMDIRVYGFGAQILRALGVRRMVVHMNTPRALKALGGFGLEIINVQPITEL